jgi:hypothetical protein
LALKEADLVDEAGHGSVPRSDLKIVDEWRELIGSSRMRR